MTFKREGKSYETWLATFQGKASAEQKHYYLESYLSWKGIDYEQFYNEYRKALKSRDTRDISLWNSSFLSFYHYLRAEGKSSSYAKNYISTIRGFIESQGLTITFSKAQIREMSRKITHPKDNFEKSEIRQLLASSPHPRNRALLYVLKDSGMAVSDVADLDISHVKLALEKGDKFINFDYVRNKTEVAGSPCLGFEALDSIREWLRWRENNGYNCSPESPLFILLQERHDEDVAYLKKLKAGIRITGRAISMMVCNAVDRAGIGDKRLSAHSFRVFNASSLESSGMNKNLVYRIQARQIPDSGRAYSKGETLNAYIKNYPALTVQAEPQIIEVQVPDERVEVLQIELELLKAMMKRRDEADKKADEMLELAEKYRAENEKQA